MQRCPWYKKHVLLILLTALAHQQAVTLHKRIHCKEKHCSRIGVLFVRALSCEGITCAQLYDAFVQAIQDKSALPIPQTQEYAATSC